jgi:GntR family transcriptional regulator, transcriptional repressor for pyruvate dehydrogenase complex
MSGRANAISRASGAAPAARDHTPAPSPVSEPERTFVAAPVTSSPGAGLPSAIIEQIQSAIFRGELRVGDRLPPERDLAVQFAVSRPTVREALRSLELVGLMEFRQGSNGGGIITNGADGFLSRALVMMYESGAFTLTQLYSARSVLEPMLIAEIMQQPDAEEHVRELRANVAEAEAAHYRRAHQRGMVVEFHGVLGRSVANPALQLLMSALVKATLAINRIYTGFQPPALDLINSHRNIAILLEQGNVESAQAAMVEHLRETADFYAQLAATEQTGSATTGSAAANGVTRAEP